MLVQIKAKVGNAFPKLMTAAVLNSCYGLTSEKDIDEIEAFFRANSLPQNTRSISQMIEVRVFEIECMCHDSPSEHVHFPGVQKKRARVKFVEKIKSSAINDPSFWDTLYRQYF